MFLPTKLREREQLCLSRHFFVAVGETGNEITLRALALCARSLSQSGPNRTLNMNRLLAGPTELMEMRNRSFSVSWNVWPQPPMSF